MIKIENLSFIKQYISKPRSIGAILPSSRHLAEKMITGIDFKSAKYIVEYGPGTGVFTEKLLANRNADTHIILLENNKDFCDLLKKKYENQPKMYIINDSAEHMHKYLKYYNIEKVDYIVSGLPFASLPQNVSSAILEGSKEYLKESGRFITFQYTLLKVRLIRKYFKNVNIKMEIRNVPPAYILCCGY